MGRRAREGQWEREKGMKLRETRDGIVEETAFDEHGRAIDETSCKAIVREHEDGIYDRIGS